MEKRSDEAKKRTGERDNQFITKIIKISSDGAAFNIYTLDNDKVCNGETIQDHRTLNNNCSNNRGEIIVPVGFFFHFFPNHFPMS